MLLENLPDGPRGTKLQLDTPIVLTDEYQGESSRLAMVIAVPKCCDVQPGDVVVCTRYPASAQDIVFDGLKLVSVEEYDILAKISGGKYGGN